MYIRLSQISELLNIKVSEQGIIVGAAVTLSEMESYLKKFIHTLPGQCYVKLMQMKGGRCLVIRIYVILITRHLHEF